MEIIANRREAPAICAPELYEFSRFNNKNDNQPKPAKATFSELCALLEKRRLTASEDEKDGPLFSGASYQIGQQRAKKNVAFVSLAILDFDSNVSFEELEKCVENLNSGLGASASVYTTYSHTLAEPKFRLVLPLAEPVAACDWPATWLRLHAAFNNKADESAKDSSRMHYLPACPKANAALAVWWVYDATPLDVATLPPLPEPVLIVKEAKKGLKTQRKTATGQAVVDNYALKALENEIKHLEKAVTGERNNSLNNAALALGHFVGAGRLTRNEVEGALLDAALFVGLSRGEALSTIKSALTAGEAEPNLTGLPIDPAKTAALLNQETSEIPIPALQNERGVSEYEASQLVQILYPKWESVSLQTNAAHAERIVDSLGNDLKFCPALGWLVFDGKKWLQDDKHYTQTADHVKVLSQTVKNEASTLYNLASDLAKSGRTSDAQAMGRAAAAHIKHAKQVEGKGFVEDALFFAAGNRKTRVEPALFDQRPFALGFENGVWDKGVFREHRREDFLLHLSPVSFLPDANQDEWLRVLEIVTDGDSDFKTTLQDFAGYILSGASHLRYLPWLYGPKATGKSTFCELLQTVLGKMAHSVDPQKLQDNSVRERLGADLWNRRLAVVAEAGGKKLEAELLKTLSGADSLTVRFLFQESFTAIPRHVLLLVSNDAPKLNAYDDALKDRVVALPFAHRLDKNGPLKLTGGARIEAVRKDPHSPLVIGFTAWAVEGLARIQSSEKIFKASAVEKATEKFWADTDTLTPFWETVDKNALRAGIPKNELRAAYQKWAEIEGAPVFNRNIWAKACESYGLQDVRSGQKRSWKLFFSQKEG